MLCRTQSSQSPISDVAKQSDGKQQQEQNQKLCGTGHNVLPREENWV